MEQAPYFLEYLEVLVESFTIPTLEQKLTDLRVDASALSKVLEALWEDQSKELLTSSHSLLQDFSILQNSYIKKRQPKKILRVLK